MTWCLDEDMPYGTCMRHTRKICKFIYENHGNYIFFDPKINRDHLLVMNNHHTKLEVPRPKRSLVIARKPFGIRTDRPTDRQTNAKQYTPTSLKGA
jgi:hypothetical protein